MNLIKISIMANINILITNFNNSGEDVLMMTEKPLAAITVAYALAQKGQTFDEVCPIKDEERQYYCFDPLWPSDATVENIHKLAQAFMDANPKDSKLRVEIRKKCGQ